MACMAVACCTGVLANHISTCKQYVLFVIDVDHDTE